MLRYSISLAGIFCLLTAHAQEGRPPGEIRDTAIVYTQPYGIRVGIDLSRPARTFIEDRYTGVELAGDYRLTQNIYLAAELGNEKRSRAEELGDPEFGGASTLYDYTTSGSYLKLGMDLNTYKNWYGMNNSIYIGGRYAFSSLSQTLHNYRIYNSNRYWNPDGLVTGTEGEEEFKGLNASWLEFILGVKAELFANIYLGASIRLGFLVSNKEADRFPNLWIPGFNKVTEDSNFGVSYNYTLSYLIPLYKKANTPDPGEDTE